MVAYGNWRFSLGHAKNVFRIIVSRFGREVEVKIVWSARLYGMLFMVQPRRTAAHLSCLLSDKAPNSYN